MTGQKQIDDDDDDENNYGDLLYAGMFIVLLFPNIFINVAC